MTGQEPSMVAHAMTLNQPISVVAYDPDAQEPVNVDDPTYFAQDLAFGISELIDTFTRQYGEGFDDDELMSAVAEALDLAKQRWVGTRDE